MNVNIGQILDRRSIRRKLTFWRIFAVLAVGIAIFGAANQTQTFDVVSKNLPHIAQVKVHGVIFDDERLLNLLEDVRESENVEAVIVSINSQGGTTAGGEALYEAVRELSRQKPTIATVGTLATSAGYMVASATDRIVARQTSIVGSIGVLFQYPQVNEMLDNLGIEMKEIKSSPLKASPSPFSEADPEAIEAVQDVIDDSYDWFVDLIADRRGFTRDQALEIADGRVFTGGQGMEMKLVDQIGGQREAIQWLIDSQNIDPELEVIPWKIPRGNSFIDLMNALSPLAPATVRDTIRFIPERLFLDGLVSIWGK